MSTSTLMRVWMGLGRGCGDDEDGNVHNYQNMRTGKAENNTVDIQEGTAAVRTGGGEQQMGPGIQKEGEQVEIT